MNGEADDRPLQGLGVFVVEDEVLLLMLAEATLEDMGAQVIDTASSVDEGLAKAPTVGAGIALLDVNLAGKMSFPIAIELRKRNIPVVFITGYARPELPVEIAGTPVLNKPYDRARLLNIMRTVLQRDQESGDECATRPSCH